MDLIYPHGNPPRHPGPLARFLPPLEEGSVARALELYGTRGDLIFDPFGVCPRLTLEAARSGFAVLVAVNNPITRFILRHTVEPFTQVDLQAALSHLAATPKDGGRLEPFLLDLYQTECARCGAPVSADYFIWDRGEEVPSHKFTMCERCNHIGESATSAADMEHAQTYTRRGLQHALALEQVAPASDPDRKHAEAALSVYPGRAVYALITLVNKLNQLTLETHLRTALEALILSAFDAVNALWGPSDVRRRPRQLIALQRYREVNVWRALEAAIGTWAMEDFGVRVIDWSPGCQPEPGMITLFPGPVRNLIPALKSGSVNLLLTVLPRPNQAYWTLSALWAAWLWGREAATPIKIALRRRRYGRVWHAGALRTVLDRVRPFIDSKVPVLAFMPEAGSGFITSALTGFDSAGFVLNGRSLRLADEQAFFTWRVAGKEDSRPSAGDLQERMAAAVRAALLARGEPAPYPFLHAAAWCDLAADRQIAAFKDEDGGHPMTRVSAIFEDVLVDRDTFTHISRGTEPESGLYWLVDPADSSIPLADRVEELVYEFLRQGKGCAESEVDEWVCKALPGLLTPDRRLVGACLRSYAQEDPDEGMWYLRSEDDPEARSKDSLEMRQLLSDIGARLDYSIQGEDPLIWLDEHGTQIFVFRISEIASLGEPLSIDPATPLIFVLPGGRAALVAEKARRDPRLRTWLEGGSRVIKFRHVRRLATEVPLSRDNLLERLEIDPPEHHDPQLPLL